VDGQAGLGNHHLIFWPTILCVTFVTLDPFYLSSIIYCNMDSSINYLLMTYVVFLWCLCFPNCFFFCRLTLSVNCSKACP
jgi:hypothetical protein